MMKESYPEGIHPDIVACYLYIIGRHGYPPQASDSQIHLEEFAGLGFRSIELEGIREAHLMEIFEMRHELKIRADELNLEVPVFCVVLPGYAHATARHVKEQIDAGVEAINFSAPWTGQNFISLDMYENILAPATPAENLDVLYEVVEKYGYY